MPLLKRCPIFSSTIHPWQRFNCNSNRPETVHACCGDLLKGTCNQRQKWGRQEDRWQELPTAVWPCLPLHLQLLLPPVWHSGHEPSVVCVCVWWWWGENQEEQGEREGKSRREWRWKAHITTESVWNVKCMYESGRETERGDDREREESRGRKQKAWS